MAWVIWAFFKTPIAMAQTTPAPTNIFDGAFGVAPQTETASIVNSPESLAGLSPGGAAGKFCSDTLRTLKPAPGITHITITSVGCKPILQFESETGGSYIAELKYRRKELWPSGTVRSNQILAATAQFSTRKEQVLVCPPDGNTAFDFTKKVGATTYCFDLNDIKSRDSCPDSGSDSDFILPNNGTSKSPICVAHDNGSSCGYNLSQDGEYYIANLEADCYTNPQDDFDGQVIPPDGNGCQDIGGGVTACPESKDNVCTPQGCKTGCGTVKYQGVEQFMCLTEDTDGDGIGDHADPDIDNDGIPNDQDTDKDGDGVQDPVYDKDNPSVQTSINTGQIVAELQTANSLLTAIKDQAQSSGIGQQAQDTLTDIKDGIEEIKDTDFTTDAAGRGFEKIRGLFNQDDIDATKAQA